MARGLALQEPDEIISFEWLDQVFVGADFHRALLVGGVTASRRDDDSRLLNIAALLANGSADLEPVAARHEQVANHRRGLVCEGELDAVFAIAGFQHVPARHREPFAHQLAEAGVVIN